jgi:hypothetical protein
MVSFRPASKNGAETPVGFLVELAEAFAFLFFFSTITAALVVCV